MTGRCVSMKRSVIRTMTMILALILLLGIAAGEDDDTDLTIEEIWDVEVEEIDLDEPMPATDRMYHTPNERTGNICDHETCFWKLNMGEMNETAIWQVLTQPVTVLRVSRENRSKYALNPVTAVKSIRAW